MLCATNTSIKVKVKLETFSISKYLEKWVSVSLISWQFLGDYSLKKEDINKNKKKRKKQRNICYSGSNEYIVREKDESHITVVETKQSRLEQDTKMESSGGETSGGVER